MKNILYAIFSLAIMMLASCKGAPGNGRRAMAEDKYSEDSILKMTLTQPELALTLLDTIEWNNWMEPYQVDFWRSIVYHNGLTNYKRARTYAQKAYNSPDIPKASEEYMSLVMMLADVCQNSGDYAESMNYCFEGLDVAEQEQNKSLEANIRVFLGVNMMSMHQEEEAFRQLEQAVGIFEKIARSSSEFGAWDDYIYSLGITMSSYSGKEMYEKAIAIFPALENALEQLRECVDVPNGLADMRQANAYATFADVYRRNGDEAKARYYYNLLDKIPFAFTPDCEQIRIPYLLADHRYREALHYINGAKDYLRENVDTVSYNYIDMFLKNEQTAYEQLGDVKTAYRVLTTISTLKDSLRSRERSEDALELAEIYKTNRQAVQLEEQRNAIKIRTVVALFSIILLIAATGILVRVMRYNKIIRKKNEAMVQTIDELMDYKHKLLVRQAENIRLRDELDKVKREKHDSSSDSVECAEMEEAMDENKGGAGEEGQPVVVLTEKDRMLYDRINYEIQSRQLYLRPEFSKKELMKQFRIPNNKFALLFKEFAGCSFLQYIQNCKINHAVCLMRENPQWTLEAIAAESQMSNGAFYSQFQKKYGMKPSDYREKMHSSI